MALHIGSDTLSSHLLIDSLGANSAFYHKRFSTKLQNEYLKKKCADRKGKIDARQKKRHLGTKLLPLRMTKKSIQVHKGQVLKLKRNLVGFDIHDIENIYLEQLSGITWNLSGYIYLSLVMLEDLSNNQFKELLITKQLKIVQPLICIIRIQ